jgi:rSAM/selenodomain-associated transferase 1
MIQIDKKEFRYTRGVVALYAKAPVLGKVKTRMQGLLGREGALSLHKALIRYVFRNLTDARLCPVQLWVGRAQAPSDSDGSHDEFFLSLCNKKDLYDQSGADLGTKMAFTARQALKDNDYVVLVGSDCASVDAAYLEQALQALESGTQIVFGPAEDGGYVLLGLRVVPDSLFASVPWGEENVMAITRQNLAAAGLSWLELEPRWDVDRPQDLPRLQSLVPAFPEY